MKKNLYRFLMVGAVGLAVGCGSGNTNPPPNNQDFSTPPDLATVQDGSAPQDAPVVVPDLAGDDLLGVDLATPPTIDMASPAPVPYATTAHDIDVNVVAYKPITPPYAYVALTNLYVFGIPSPKPNTVVSSAGACKYILFTQDATCSTPPCGIELTVSATGLTPKAACPASLSAATTVASGLHSGAGLNVGDTIDVVGNTNYFTASSNYGVANHQVAVTSVSLSSVQATAPVPSPVALPSLFAVQPSPSPVGFVSGTGWATYEGTYVKVQSVTPLNIVATGIKSKSSNLLDVFTASLSLPAIATALDTARFELAIVGITLPTANSTYTSISGWVYTDWGGSIVPLSQSDLVP